MKNKADKKIFSIVLTAIMVLSVFAMIIPASAEHTATGYNYRSSFPQFVSPMEGVSWDRYIPDRIQPPEYTKSLQDILIDAEVLKSTPHYQPPAVTGNRELLVILVNFSDVTAAQNDVYFENMMWGPSPSLMDYYTEVSYGIFTYIAGQVLDPGADNVAPFWYAAPYTQAQGAQQANFRALVAWAIGAADADFNFAPYDTNTDGTVTNDELTIIIVCSGTAGDMGGAGPWSHHWWTTAPVATGDGVNVEGEYSMTCENNPMGTHAHELGHDLGLPDLYDTDGAITGGSAGIGHYGLMGSGAWCGPTHMTAWSKIQLGWLTPTVVTANNYFDVRDVETNAEAYILHDSAHSTDEYFLVENRWRGTSYDNVHGLEGDLDDQGCLIYHIDDDKATGWWTSGTNDVNVDETHKGVDVETAEHPTSHVVDADDLDAEVNRGDSDDLWDINEYDFDDTSVPCNANWYGGTLSGMDVTNFPVASSTMRVFLSIFPNTPPVADADGPYTAPEGTAITFDASGSTDVDVDPLQYRWDFDNDGTWDTGWSNDPTAEYTWCDEHTGRAKVEVSDGQLTDTATALVTVLNVAPIVDAGPDRIVDEGDTVSFSGISIDPGCDTWTYEWDFGDGSPIVTGTLTPTHAYCDNGVYPVRLTVTDGDGGVGSDTLTVTVNNVAPIVDAGSDQTVDEGDTVIFSGSSTDPGCDTWTYEWDFGDVSPVVTGTLTPTHAYGDNGVYIVTLTVRDDDGGVGSDTLTVTVNNVAPIVDALPTETIDEGDTVSFTGHATDPGSDDLTFAWAWQHRGICDKTTTYYNDGIGPDPYPSPDVNPMSATDSASCQYGDNGVYTVTLTVTDDDGDSTTVTTTVTVNNVDPTASIAMTQPNLQFILPIVHTLTFDGSSEDPGSDDLTFVWDFNDGTVVTTTYYNNDPTPDPYPSPDVNPMDVTDTQTHIYASPGTYIVSLPVTDDDSGVGSDTHTVIVFTAEEAKHDINDYIQSLPGGAFKRNPTQRKNAFNNMFTAIDDMLVDMEYEGAIQDLQNNIRAKADGLVDGDPKNDWIIDQGAQEHICMKIDDLTAYLEYLKTLEG